MGEQKHHQEPCKERSTMTDLPDPRRKPSDAHRELQSTYFVQDKSNQDEVTRVRIQDQMITSMMGGVLPEQPDPTKFERVLDVGCGTGGWLIEVARTYPSIKRLVGVDISKRMVDYARELAKEQQVDDRVEFFVMDALRLLEFPDNYFDLVNQRFGVSWLRTWDWPKVLGEYQRITRAHGTIRITEAEFVTASSNPAHLRLNQLMLQALHNAGNVFTPESDGVTSQLAPLLHQYAGIRDQQTRSHTLRYRVGTPEWQIGYDDTRLIYRTTLPFLRKWTQVPDDYEQIYQQMLSEMQQSDFTATWNLLTAWGTKGQP
jgi:ubiquinone/menaquinone biosynthesis C-methylase UbiE